MNVVLDNTILSIFGRLKRYHVLESLLSGTEVTVPKQVLEEYSLIFEPVDKIPSMFKIVDIKIKDKTGLGKGENAGIELAKRDNAVFVTDDLRARKIAEKEGIEVTGTIGLLIAGCKTKKISKKDATEFLKDVHKKRLLYLSEKIFNEVLETIRKT